MSIFEFTNYKTFLKRYLHSLPKRGHGESVKWAKAIGVNTTMVSRIINGDGQLSQEQALRLVTYLELSEIEKEYFMNLVLYNRAGDRPTELYYRDQLNRIKSKNETIKERLNITSDMQAENQSRYYSNWYYSAIWLLSAIEKYQSKDEIIKYLGLPEAEIIEAINFLIQIGLVEDANGRIKLKGQNIHVSADSPLVRRHHLNWRWVAINKLEKADLSKFTFFTSPVVLSEEDTYKVKEMILKMLTTFRKITEPSECQKLYCLNIDWFEV